MRPESVEVAKQVKEETRKILARSVDDYVGEKKLGIKRAFTGQRDRIEEVRSLLQRLAPLSIENLPLRKLKELRTAIEEVGQKGNSLVNFEEEGSRQNVVGQYETAAESLREMAMLPLAYLSIREPEVELLAGRVDMHVDTIMDLTERTELLEQKRGVQYHSKDFRIVAKAHKCSSILWTVAAVIFATGTCAVAIWYPFDLDSLKISGATKLAEITLDDMQFLASKLVTLSILYMGTLFCMRNYRSHRHLAVVNDHKANALSTFETFVKGTADPQTKNAVLLESTRTIFTPSMTGYLGKDEEGPAGRVVETVRSMGPSVLDGK